MIAFLDQEDDYDMGFLKDIEEVSGFVFIVGNHFSHLNLTNLRVIRGKTLYTHDNSSSQMYSLFVANNYKRGSTTVGLKELGLVSLTGTERICTRTHTRRHAHTHAILTAANHFLQQFIMLAV